MRCAREELLAKKIKKKKFCSKRPGGGGEKNSLLTLVRICVVICYCFYLFKVTKHERLRIILQTFLHFF